MINYEIEASIIIPVYNTAGYIERAVKSVLNQTFQNFEIILVDDGSTDTSWEVCKQLINLSEKIHIFHKENAGVSSARNLGLREAKGKYIFFLDSDDEWKQNLLEQIISCFYRTDCDCVRFQAVSTDSDIFSYRVPEVEEATFQQRDFLVKAMSDREYHLNISSACWGAYRNSLVRRENIYFSEKLAQGEDGLFVLNYLVECKKIAYLNERLYIYHIYNPEERLSATGRGEKVLYDAYELHFLLYNKLYEKYEDIFLEEEKESVYAFFYDRMIAYLVRFASYSKHLKWKDKIDKIRILLNSKLMKEAAIYYKPSRKTDSRIIPFFMKHKQIFFLWIVLCAKTMGYYKLCGRKRYAVSIYKENKTVEYWNN